jgi:hypothetical protein
MKSISASGTSFPFFRQVIDFSVFAFGAKSLMVFPTKSQQISAGGLFAFCYFFIGG